VPAIGSIVLHNGRPLIASGVPPVKWDGGRDGFIAKETERNTQEPKRSASGNPPQARSEAGGHYVAHATKR